MTPHEFATRLNGREYGSEITKTEEAEAKAFGLVVVFGYSDDNVELRGAINDECGAYNGTTLRVGRDGLVPDWESVDHDSEEDAKDYFDRLQAGFAEINAIFDSEGYTWTYETEIPYSVFDVMEDGDKFCRGIVFRLSDVQSEKEAA